MALKLFLMKKERLLLLLMKNNISHHTKDIFLYNEFVCSLENDYGYLDSWLNMEILNALALDEWEVNGCPVRWNLWNYKYKEKAIKLVEQFLLEQKCNSA
ncbi:hypothetical protein A4G16_00435 [Mannheimia granulomatis]|uniref:Uncharacterized protein n=1 Tax=Mannheimia granulomatis TaxID=85402 RepID=A0A6G8JFG3_9PAST|nr:hypothetical protein [Mannheimia granulomatis]QIM65952.1 hypothetical protein A4G16_00435 [Mannheimia granulomatis]